MLIDCEIEALDVKNRFKKDISKRLDVSKTRSNKKPAVTDSLDSDFELVDLKVKKVSTTPTRVEEYYGLPPVNKSELMITIT